MKISRPNTYIESKWLEMKIDKQNWICFIFSSIQCEIGVACSVVLHLKWLKVTHNRRLYHLITFFTHTFWTLIQLLNTVNVVTHTHWTLFRSAWICQRNGHEKPLIKCPSNFVAAKKGRASSFKQQYHENNTNFHVSMQFNCQRLGIVLT